MDNTNKQKRTYPVTVGASYLYIKKHLKEFFSISFTEDVDGDALRKTADQMMERCPYFHTKLKEEDGSFVLEESDDRLPVYRKNGYISVDDPESCGFLLTVSYWDKTVYFGFDHGLTDGMGGIMFTKSFAAAYINNRYGLKLTCPDAVNIWDEPEDCEYEDPYLKTVHMERPFAFKKKGTPFEFPEEDICKGSRAVYVHVPTADVLRLSKNTESNFSSVFAMFLCRAISKVYPTKDMSIMVKCPTDIRSMIDSRRNFQNCHCGINYVYSEKLRGLPFDQQLSCFKGMMMIQTSAEFLMEHFEKKKNKYEKVQLEKPALEDKIEFYDGGESRGTPVVSYLRTVDFGECSPYVTNFTIDTALEGNIGMRLLPYCGDDECHINLRTNLKSDDCVNAFLDTLAELNIPYRVEPINSNI